MTDAVRIDQEHVALSREATAAGLVVTELMPLRCDHGVEYAVQLWTVDGTLWAEGTHESADRVRAHIRHYVASR